MSQNPQAQQPKRISSGVLTLIIVLAVVVVALAVGIALLVLQKPGPAGTTSAPPATQTTTTAPPVTRAPTFLDGHNILATMDEAVTTEQQVGLIGATSDAVIAYSEINVQQPVAYDLATGRVLWQMYAQCTNLIAGKSLVCGIPKGYDPATGAADSWSYAWVDAATGQSGGSLDTSMLGQWVIASVATSQGELMIGTSVNEDHLYSGTVNAVIGYYTGPGAPVWTLKVRETATTSEFFTSFEESGGLYVWNVDGTVFVIDAATGTLVQQAQAYQAQVFSSRVVYLGVDEASDLKPEQVIDVQGSSPVTIRALFGGDSWMLDYAGVSHPDMLFITGEYGTQAIDPVTGLDGNPAWQSPEQGNADAWPIIVAMAWDGDHTAFAFGQNGSVWAFDVQTGQQLWTATVTGAKAPQFNAGDITIAYSGSVVLAQGYDSANDATVSVLLRADNGQPVTGFADGLQYLALKDGALLFADANGAVSIAVPSF